MLQRPLNLLPWAVAAALETTTAAKAAAAMIGFPMSPSEPCGCVRAGEEQENGLKPSSGPSSCASAPMLALLGGLDRAALLGRPAAVAEDAEPPGAAAAAGAQLPVGVHEGDALADPERHRA